MSLYNSTLPEYRAIELNTAALALIQEFALSAVPTTAQISLSSLSFGQEHYLLPHGSPRLHEYIGVLTIIVGTSIYFLMSEDSFIRVVNAADSPYYAATGALLDESTSTYSSAPYYCTLLPRYSLRR